MGRKSFRALAGAPGLAKSKTADWVLGGVFSYSFWYVMKAGPTWRILLVREIFRPWSRASIRIAVKTVMTAITRSRSMRANLSLLMIGPHTTNLQKKRYNNSRKKDHCTLLSNIYNFGPYVNLLYYKPGCKDLPFSQLFVEKTLLQWQKSGKRFKKNSSLSPISHKKIDEWNFLQFLLQKGYSNCIITSVKSKRNSGFMWCSYKTRNRLQSAC